MGTSRVQPGQSRAADSVLRLMGEEPGSVEKSSPAAGIELADPSRGDRRSERSGRR